MKSASKQAFTSTPHGPSVELVRELVTSGLRYGIDRASHLKKPKDFTEAVRLYEAALHMRQQLTTNKLSEIVSMDMEEDYLSMDGFQELADKLSEIIRCHVDEEYLSTEEIQEFFNPAIHQQF